MPLGTAAHYGFLKQMEHFGVDSRQPGHREHGPAGWRGGLRARRVDMVCGWGGALRRMKEHGNVLLTGAEKDRAGHPGV